MMRWWSALLFALLVPCAAYAAGGDPVKGHEDFRKFRCDTCHSVYGQQGTNAPVPLRDLSRESNYAIAHLIVERTHLAPEALFDQMAMSSAASYLSQEQLMDIVAFLRDPSAAEKRQKKLH